MLAPVEVVLTISKGEHYALPRVGRHKAQPLREISKGEDGTLPRVGRHKAQPLREISKGEDGTLPRVGRHKAQPLREITLQLYAISHVLPVGACPRGRPHPSHITTPPSPPPQYHAVPPTTPYPAAE